MNAPEVYGEIRPPTRVPAAPLPASEPSPVSEPSPASEPSPVRLVKLIFPSSLLIAAAERARGRGGRQRPQKNAGAGPGAQLPQPHRTGEFTPFSRINDGSRGRGSQRACVFPRRSRSGNLDYSIQGAG